MMLALKHEGCQDAGFVVVDNTGHRFNTLRPRQNGHYLTDIFKCIFLKANVWILINISLKFVPKGPINNIPPLVQIMARCRPGGKPLSEPMLVHLLTHVCVTRAHWVKSMTTYGWLDWICLTTTHVLRDILAVSTYGAAGGSGFDIVTTLDLQRVWYKVSEMCHIDSVTVTAARWLVRTHRPDNKDSGRRRLDIDPTRVFQIDV